MWDRVNNKTDKLLRDLIRDDEHTLRDDTLDFVPYRQKRTPDPLHILTFYLNEHARKCGFGRFLSFPAKPEFGYRSDMLPNQDGIPSLVYVPHVWDDDDREEWDGLSIPMRFGYGDGFLRMPSDETPVVPIHCTWYTPAAINKYKKTPICMVDAADPSYLVVFYVAEKPYRLYCARTSTFRELPTVDTTVRDRIAPLYGLNSRAYTMLPPVPTWRPRGSAAMILAESESDVQIYNDDEAKIVQESSMSNWKALADYLMEACNPLPVGHCMLVSEIRRRISLINKPTDDDAYAWGDPAIDQHMAEHMGQRLAKHERGRKDESEDETEDE